MVLRAGAGYGGCDKTDPSYFAPAYYKVFATVMNDTSWNTLATDTYSLLSTLQGKMSGLVPNWTDSSGTIPSGDDGKYGPDASRTPWRIETDYVWNGEAKAVTFLDNVVKYVDANGGVQRLLSPNSTYRGPLGLSAVHKDAKKAKDYSDAWLTTSVDDTTYFPGTLRPIYMLLATQKFSKGCY
jgi:endo-1,4-beta-D-glucanase Y